MKYDVADSRHMINKDLERLTQVKKEPEVIRDKEDDLPPILQVFHQPHRRCAHLCYIYACTCEICFTLV